MSTRRRQAGLGSLSTRLLLPLLLTIIAVLAISALINLRAVEEQFTELVSTDAQRCAGLVERATHDGMLLNRKDQVQNIIQRLSQDSSVTGIRIYDMEGEITMSATPAEIGLHAGLRDAPCSVCHSPELPGLPEAVIARDGEADFDGTGFDEVLARRTGLQPDRPVLRHLSVIPNEQACSAAGCHVPASEQSKLGVLEVEVSLQPLEDTLQGSRRQTLWTMGVLMLITGLVATAFVQREVLRPVERLHEGTEQIARGDLDTRLSVHGGAELADLAAAFNGMAADLAAARDELADWSRKLEQQVLHKTDELQRTQRQVVHMEKMASLGKLSATVAHELNNPISAMLTYARLAERELQHQQALPEEVREEVGGYLRFLQQECSRCGNIVQNLLLFARRMSGTEMAPVDLNEVVERSLMLIRHHLEMSNVQLHRELLDGDPEIFADAGQVEQALVALMVNAVESMSGGGELTVRLTGDGETVHVEISDTGVGIPEEVRPHIFEPFFSTKAEQSGVGLGLAVVYGIVQRHGGEIDVDSAPDRGTTFHLRLPRRPRRARVEGPVEEGAAEEGVEEAGSDPPDVEGGEKEGGERDTAEDGSPPTAPDRGSAPGPHPQDPETR